MFYIKSDIHKSYFSFMISGVLGEAMQTQCKKCTEKQKALLDRMADWYTTNKPDAWEALIKKQVEDALKKSG